MGVPTRHIVDEAGERLYATFFYVEVAFPPDRPISSFGENDQFTVMSSVARYGTSMVDGIWYLYRGPARPVCHPRRSSRPWTPEFRP